MNVLVTGGAASGKSAFAERLACSLSTMRTYVATMAEDGSEAQARIARHRQQRAGLGFVTLVCAGSLPAPDACHGVVLVDDLGNLVAQALFAADGTMADPASVLEQLDGQFAALFAVCEHVVVVGNEVGAEGRSPYDGVRVWVQLIGALACRVAARADAVVELSSGIPCALKGVLP